MRPNQKQPPAARHQHLREAALPEVRNRALFALLATSLILASHHFAQATPPTNAEIGQKNSEFLHSGETERKIEELRHVTVSTSTPEDKAENEVITELLEEFSKIIPELRDLDTRMSQASFFDFSQLKSTADIDVRIKAIDRADELNKTVLTESYWNDRLRKRLQDRKVSKKRENAIVASFLKGVHEGLQNRLKQIGLSSEADVKKYREAQESDLKISRDIFTLLKTEFGHWKIDKDQMDFSNPAAAKKYAELYSKLSQ